MQIAPQPPQKAESGLHLRRRFVPPAMQLIEPADQLMIAQAAGSLLHVRLQVIERARVLPVAGPRQLRQVAHQRPAVAQDEARQLFRQAGVERAVAGEVALVEQADVQLDVALVNLGALGRRPDGVADAQAGVPQVPQKRRDGVLRVHGQLLGFEQQQQVHIRVREQLAAAIAAHREHRQTGWRGRKQQPRRGFQHQAVHLRVALGQSGRRIAGSEEVPSDRG